MESVAVIGGGPAGLMAADVLSEHGAQVDLYEAKASVGRKFLVAGKGGLNLTHVESFDSLVGRYGAAAGRLKPILKAFGPEDVSAWCHALGIPTFVGQSGRVFPEHMKAFPLLQRWIVRLKSRGVRIHTRHRWLGWNAEGRWLFQSPSQLSEISPQATVMTLGGASWPALGSDGAWVPLLRQQGMDVAPLQPANCGFEVPFGDHFRQRYAGEPLKSVALRFTGADGQSFQRRGACVVTSHGLEGSLIYAASALIREEINARGSATIVLDLAPDRSESQLSDRLSLPRGSRSWAGHLRSKVKLKGVEAGLLREFAAESFGQPSALARAIKHLSIPITAARPLDEAISTAGGVRFESLDDSLMLKTRPGVFCAGEMLDWEAPTGGYLLTACLASGRMAGQGALAWAGKSS